MWKMKARYSIVSSWFMVHGSWFMVQGSGFMALPPFLYNRRMKEGNLTKKYFTTMNYEL